MTQPAVHYELRVTGVLDGGWSAWFDGLGVTGDVSQRLHDRTTTGR
jgi:hypothetical protein